MQFEISGSGAALYDEFEAQHLALQLAQHPDVEIDELLRARRVVAERVELGVLHPEHRRHRRQETHGHDDERPSQTPAGGTPLDRRAERITGKGEQAHRTSICSSCQIHRWS